MARYIYVKAGFITNIVEHSNGAVPLEGPDGEVVLADPGGVNAGDVFDVTDELRNRRFDKADVVIFSELRRLTNEIRALRVPPDPPISVAQYKANIKAQF